MRQEMLEYRSDIQKTFVLIRLSEHGDSLKKVKVRQPMVALQPGICNKNA
jgi:hypothetical protein